MARTVEKVACPRCAQLFAKSSLARHLARKTPCTPVAVQAEEARAEAVAEAVEAVAENPLKAAVWRARDILRRAGITGLVALDCIVTVIVLREAERLYGAELDAIADATDPAKPNLRMPLGVRALFASKAHKFSAFAARVFDDGTGRDWAGEVRALLDALRFVPAAAAALGPVIAERDKLFALRDSRAAFELVRHVRDAITFDAAADTLGGAFQSVIRDLLDGKELGQFFTPPSVVRRAIEAATRGAPICTAGDAALANEGTSSATAAATTVTYERRALGEVLDPTCGSGAFLAAAALAGGIPHGVEIDARVMVIGCANVLLASGRPPRIVRGDFLRDALPAPSNEVPPAEGEDMNARHLREGARQFDTVLANPPFGVKGIDYEETARMCAAPGAFPLKSTATGLFLQRIVRSVRVGGRGVVVLPLGKELASASAAEVRFRQALLRAINLREVFAVGAGEFENTGIRTAVLVFDKVRELAECVAKKGKGMGVNADVPLATASIVFHPAEGEPVTVDAAALEAAHWSLSPDAYIMSSAVEEGLAQQYAEGVRMVKLGEILTLKKGKVQASKVVPGNYPVISIGLGKTHNEATDDGEVLAVTTVFSGGFGSCGARIHYHEGPCTITSLMGRLETCDPTVYLKYVGIQLKSMIDYINKNCEKGLANKTLDVTKFMDLQIPLPPIERQREIAAELDRLAGEADALERAAEIMERHMHIGLDNSLYKAGHYGKKMGFTDLRDGVQIVTLGEICLIKPGKSITKSYLNEGETPVIGGGKSPLGYHDASNTHANSVLISCTGASIGWISRYPVPTFINADCASIIPIDNKCEEGFMYYVLKQNYATINAMRTGLAQPHLNKRALSEFSFPLPPIDHQRDLVAEFDLIASEVTSLKKHAADIRSSMPEVLSLMLSGAGTDPAAVTPDEDLVGGLDDARGQADAEGYEEFDIEEDECGASGSGIATLE